MADLTFRRNRKAMMLYGSGESSIPAHAKRGTIHGVAGSTVTMPFSPLAKTVRHDSVRLQRGPSEPALEQLELLKQDLSETRRQAQICRRSIGRGRGEPESSLDYPDPHIVHCVHLPHDENGWRWLR